MIKNLNGSKLSKTGAHRRAMFRNMLTSLIMEEKVVTTLPKARTLKRYADTVITDAKKGRYFNVRSWVNNKDAFKKLVNVLSPRYKEKSSGYTSIIKIGNRKGDAALMAMVKLVD